MSGPQFVIDFEPHYGEMVDVSPLLRRLVCQNPSKFTFHGTGTYVIGRGDVAIVDPGPRDDQHVEALLRAHDGETVRHILITHTHGDHSPAAAAIAEATGAPILGFGPHPSTAVGEGEDVGRVAARRDAAVPGHLEREKHRHFFVCRYHVRTHVRV